MKRPKIKLVLSRSDKVVEVLGWTLLFMLWCLVLLHYPNLPDTIPTHYNSAGEADAFGTKKHIIGLPLIATLLFGGMTVLNKFPHLFNYPNKITAATAPQQYTNATRMIRYMKLVIVIIFGMIATITIRNAGESTTDLGSWFLPVALVMLIAPAVFFLAKSISKKVR